MSASISHAAGPADVVNTTSAEDDIHDRDNELPATVSETGSHASDSSTYDTYLHGTCPGCHHWLNKFPIKLFGNRRKHKRFQCPRCQRLLLGLGGNSTQTTLVSQETISRRGSGASAAENSTGFHGCTNMRSLEASRDGNLKTIIEASPSNGVSREPSQRSAAPREQSQSATHRHQDQPAVLRTISTGQGYSARAATQFQPDQTDTVLPDSGRFKRIKRHANRLLRKVKDFKTHFRKPENTGLGLVAKDHTPKLTSDVSAATLGKEASSTSKPTNVDPSIPFHRQRVSKRPLGEKGSSAEPPNARLNSTHGDPRDNQVEGPQEEITAANKKRERIRCIRREKKLRAEALQKPRCECTEGCQCMQRETASRSSGEGQSRPVHPADIEPPWLPRGVESPDETRNSSTLESRRISSDVSSEGRQQSPYRIEFAGIGDGFGERRRSCGRVRPLSSLSQAPTAVSNGSSISLHSGPAYVARHPPGSRPQTPHLQVSPDGEPDEDEERGGPTPTQHNTTTQWALPSAEDARAANTSSTLLEEIEDEIHDRSLVDHDGAFLPQSGDAE